MRFRETSAWLMVGTLLVSYGWYVVTVVQQLGASSVADVEYQRTAIVAAVAVVILAAVSHIVLAATGGAGPTDGRTGAAAIKRYARSTGGVVIAAAAVLGMALAMVEADHFWIANVILAGLVASELVAAGAEILYHRREERHARAQ